MCEPPILIADPRDLATSITINRSPELRARILRNATQARKRLEAIGGG